MLPIFPGSFFDELFSSRVSRFHQLRGHKAHTRTYKELFDSAPFVLNLLVPASLDVLVKKLPGNHYETMKSILDENTLFPLFQTFGGSRIIKPSTAESDDYKLSAIPKRIVGGTGTTHLCPKCVEDDFLTVGTPYIHRSHQIPGVLVCWKHGNLLLNQCSFCGCPFERKRELNTVPWQRCICEHSVQSMCIHDELPEKDMEVAVPFAKFCHELLQTSGQELDAKCLVQVYRRKIFELGFKRKSAITRTEMMDAIVKFYGHDLLARIDTAYRNDRISSWFNYIMEVSTFDVPLNRHLIHAFFLFREADVFWNAIKIEKNNIDGIEHGEVKALKDKISNRYRKRRIKNVDNVAESKKSNILDELKLIRNNHPEYKLNDYWLSHFGLMKRLVITCQEEFHKFRVSVDNGDASINQLDKPLSDMRKEKYYQIDSVASGEIERIAISFYASDEKPVKVTKNAILKKTGLVSKINTNPNVFPLSIQKLNNYVESRWHFYARRIIWAMLKLGKPALSASNIIQPAGVIHSRGLELIKYFHNVKTTQKLRKGTIIGIIIEHGIGKDWDGPCPDRQFIKYGRAYIKQSKIQSTNKDTSNTAKEAVSIPDVKTKKLDQERYSKHTVSSIFNTRKSNVAH